MTRIAAETITTPDDNDLCGLKKGRWEPRQIRVDNWKENSDLGYLGVTR